jgi:hypothetical protein
MIISGILTRDYFKLTCITQQYRRWPYSRTPADVCGLHVAGFMSIQWILTEASTVDFFLDAKYTYLFLHKNFNSVH